MKTVVVSGYFLFPHVGHIRLFQAARALGDRLVVIVNNDVQQRSKYGLVVVPEAARLEVVASIRYVDQVLLSIDQDRTVCRTLAALKPDVFANGGDQNRRTVPEAEVCRRLGIELVDDVGGAKLDSSSRILAALRALRK